MPAVTGGKGIKMKNYNHFQRITFSELKKAAQSTAGIPTPTAKMLLNRGSKILAQEEMADGSSLIAFQNGFALYQTFRHYTVVRIDECGDYTYLSGAESHTFSEEDFANMPWSVRIQMEAEDRIVHNMDSYAEDGVNSENRWYAAWKLQENAVEPDISDEVSEISDRMQKAIEKLTERQRKMLRLYYFEGYQQPEIAKMLGISASAVTQALAAARKKIMKFY